MRKLLYILFILLILSSVMSCGRSVDKRLVLADTLMWTAPDSSLAILNAIDRDSLGDDENLAYHALLLTQAQFRVNYASPSDSLINYAIDCYDDNHNREHYTRALLYKGAYYEVHDNPVEAIKWYKRAEDNADTTDYRNLAQINLRMGMLYYKNYASNNLDLEKFKESYMYYKKIGDKHMMLFSIHHIGNLYRDTNKKGAISLLTQASNLAKELNDTVSYYIVLSDLSLAFLLDSCFEEAKATALKCYEMDGKYATNLVHCDASNAYAELNMADSARYYINKVKIDNCSQHDSMMYAYTLSRVFKAEGNINDALKQKNLSDEITQKILEESKRNIIHETEKLEDSRILRDKNSTLSSVEWKATLVSLLALFLLIILGYYVWRFKRYRQLVDELKQEQQITDSLIAEYKEKTSTDGENKELHSTIVSYLEQHFNSLKSLIEKSNSMKHSDFVKLLKERSSQLGANNEMSKLLIMLADDKYNNLISKFSELYPSLNENELKIISLISLGYHNEEIAFCTGMEVPSVRTKKTRIKIKMKLPMSLDAFVTQEKLKHSS